MRNGSAAPEAILRRIAEALDEALSGDARLHAGAAMLRRRGLQLRLVLRIERGAAAPRVDVEHAGTVVPEWSSEDAAVLRSLGIAAELHERVIDSQAKPRRRQPR